MCGNWNSQQKILTGGGLVLTTVSSWVPGNLMKADKGGRGWPRMLLAWFDNQSWSRCVLVLPEREPSVALARRVCTKVKAVSSKIYLCGIVAFNTQPPSRVNCLEMGNFQTLHERLTRLKALSPFKRWVLEVCCTPLASRWRVVRLSSLYTLSIGTVWPLLGTSEATAAWAG